MLYNVFLDSVRENVFHLSKEVQTKDSGCFVTPYGEPRHSVLVALLLFTKFHRLCISIVEGKKYHQSTVYTGENITHFICSSALVPFDEGILCILIILSCKTD